MISLFEGFLRKDVFYDKAGTKIFLGAVEAMCRLAIAMVKISNMVKQKPLVGANISQVSFMIEKDYL